MYYLVEAYSLALFDDDVRYHRGTSNHDWVTFKKLWRAWRTLNVMSITRMILRTTLTTIATWFRLTQFILIKFVVYLLNLLACLNTSHYWHFQVKYDYIKMLRHFQIVTASIFFTNILARPKLIYFTHVFLDYSDSLVAINSCNNINLLKLADDLVLDDWQLERIVIYNQIFLLVYRLHFETIWTLLFYCSA